MYIPLACVRRIDPAHQFARSPADCLPEIPPCSTLARLVTNFLASMRTYVRACVSLAAVAIASGLVSVHAAQAREGPGFDCTKAQQPLAQIICSSDDLSKIDLGLNEAYNAYRDALALPGKKKLAQDEVVFIRRVISLCRIPNEVDVGELNEGTDDTLPLIRCIANAYTARTNELRGLLTGSGVAPNTTSSAGTMPQPALPATTNADEPLRIPTIATKNDEILVPGSINGRPVTFMVDSGATSVAIPFLIAKKLELGAPIDTVGVTFADGRVAAHAVHLIRTLRIGDAEIHDVRATVGGDGDSILLGRSALNRFAGWAVDTSNGFLLLFRAGQKITETATSAQIGAALTRGLADGLPKQVGQCTTTKIAAIASRFGEPLRPPAGPLDTAGTAIKYANEGYQVSYDYVPAIAQSRVGDDVRLCLVSVPKDCPPGDERGKEYSASNLRTGGKWVLPDAQHMCGGA